MEISASQFKAECLKLMNQVEKTRKPIIITKHGRPVAQLIPVQAEARSLFGYMKDSLKTGGDIVSPHGTKWSAVSGEEDQLFGKTSARKTRKK